MIHPTMQANIILWRMIQCAWCSCIICFRPFTIKALRYWEAHQGGDAEGDPERFGEGIDRTPSDGHSFFGGGRKSKFWKSGEGRKRGSARKRRERNSSSLRSPFGVAGGGTPF